MDDSHPIKLANLFGLLNASSSQCISSTQPLNIEQFHKDHPLIWYNTILPFDSSNLTIPSFEDYAYIFLDKQFKVLNSIQIFQSFCHSFVGEFEHLR